MQQSNEEFMGIAEEIPIGTELNAFDEESLQTAL
jgi:recombinational DNA repair protein RecR